MNIKTRVEKLESCLLPKPDFQPEIYDFLVQAEMATFSTEAEDVERYGSKSDWLNDRRID